MGTRHLARHRGAEAIICSAVHTSTLQPFPVIYQLSDQVTALLRTLASETLSALDCMKRLGLSHRPTFRANYLSPVLESTLIERTIHEKPNSRLQKYQLAAKGVSCLS